MSSFPQEQLLWKLGVGTLFILTHRFLQRQKRKAIADHSDDKNSTEHPEEKKEPEFLDVSQKTLTEQPSEALQSILTQNTQHFKQLCLPPSDKSTNEDTTTTTTNKDSQAFYQQLIDHRFHDNESVETSFQETIKH